ncbi:hypothetical protein QE152_g36851 [Popillia japonica]|uniref:Uncharacterized protein n=1 Tax=Popillia japonica TaxID=7064 RepID=A0AAW1IC00_POPJA
MKKYWHKILAHVANNDADAEYDAEDLIPLSQLRCNILSLDKEITDVSDMLNVLSDQDLTNVEIRNWLENDEDLLRLEDLDVADEHHDSDNENPKLDTNKTVKNDEAVKSIMNMKKIKQTRITNYFTK